MARLKAYNSSSENTQEAGNNGKCDTKGAYNYLKTSICTGISVPESAQLCWLTLAAAWFVSISVKVKELNIHP